MITVREAAEKAAQFAKGVLDEVRSKELRLEEVEIKSTPDGNRWLITLSMPQINSFGFPQREREYKTFFVDGETGEVLAMKIRELATSE